MTSRAAMMPGEKLTAFAAGIQWAVLLGDGMTLVYWVFEPPACGDVPMHEHVVALHRAAYGPILALGERTSPRLLSSRPVGHTVGQSPGAGTRNISAARTNRQYSPTDPLTVNQRVVGSSPTPGALKTA
jgi:hypothetical protein